MCICVHPSLHLRDTLISLSGNQKEKEMKGTLTMSFECVIILSLFFGVGWLFISVFNTCVWVGAGACVCVVKVSRGSPEAGACRRDAHRRQGKEGIPLFGSP